MNAKNSLRMRFENSLLRNGFNYVRSRDDDLFIIYGDDREAFLPQSPVGIKFPGEVPFEVRVRSYEITSENYKDVISAVDRLAKKYSVYNKHHCFTFCRIQVGVSDFIACGKPEAYVLGIVNDIPRYVHGFSTSWKAVEHVLEGRSAVMLQDSRSEACLIPTKQWLKRITQTANKHLRTYVKGWEK